MLVTNKYLSEDKTQLQIIVEIDVSQKDAGKSIEILPIDGRFKAMAKSLLGKENIEGDWKCIDIRVGPADWQGCYVRSYQFSYTLEK